MCGCDCVYFGLSGVVIELEQLDYTVTEGQNVSICANITAGVSDKILTLNITTMEGTATCMYYLHYYVPILSYVVILQQ